MLHRRILITLALVLVATGLTAQVPYRLQGELHVTPEGVTLHAADGRVFKLDLAATKAKAFHDKTVVIEGKAAASDRTDSLEVDKVALSQPDPKQVELPPFKAFQRPMRMLNDGRDEIQLGDVRWSFKPEGDKQVFQWETVTVKPALLDRVFFVKKPFPPEWLAAHSLYLFTFKDGGVVDSRGKQARGLALSIEAYQREGQSYGLTTGLKKTFPIVWIVCTWEDYAALNCGLPGKGKNKLIPYPMKIDRHQGMQLLRESLRQAAVNRAGEFYHTVTNNCTNNLVILLNRVLPKDKQIKQWLIPSLVYNLKATMPVWVPKMLIKKGLMGEAAGEINASNHFVDFNKVIAR